VSSQTTSTLFLFEIKLFAFLRVNRKTFFASIEQIFERRSSRQWKDVQAKEHPSSITDETPVRGNWSAHMPRPQSKICLKKENTVSERDKYSSLKDCGKIPLQRFRPSASKKKLASKTRLRLQSPRLYMQWTNMHHTWERSSTDEPITARRRTHPAQTARDSCQATKRNARRHYRPALPAAGRQVAGNRLHKLRCVTKGYFKK